MESGMNNGIVLSHARLSYGITAYVMESGII